jgi:hypothetical protein
MLPADSRKLTISSFRFGHLIQVNPAQFRSERERFLTCINRERAAFNSL